MKAETTPRATPRRGQRGSYCPMCRSLFKNVYLCLICRSAHLIRNVNLDHHIPKFCNHDWHQS